MHAAPRLGTALLEEKALKYRFLAVLATMMLVVSACTGGGSSPSADGEESEGAPESAAASEGTGWPEELVIGFVPSSEAGQLVEDIEPLAAYLAEQLGITVTGSVSNDYTGMVTAMETGQAQIAALPPYGLLQAIDRASAEVILQSERFGSGTYHTQFFTTDPDTYCTDEPEENIRIIDDAEVTFLNCNGTARANDETPEGPIGLEALADLPAGTIVSFVEQTSSSGYIFPATVLLGEGIDPETDIDPLFAGSHDASVIAVCDGDAEIGVSFDDARTIATSECDIPGTVVVFAYGGEIPNDGIAVSGDLPDDLKDAIKQALIDYAETEEGAAVLESIYQITAFTEPNLEALELVRQAVDELGYEG
jgi:phosphonate transport system substrate-binding protein